MFQSTYLYKVRLSRVVVILLYRGFNPRTYIRYDGYQRPWYEYVQFQSTYLYKVRREIGNWAVQLKCFNPRTYIRYDSRAFLRASGLISFNPRTYIRYDSSYIRARKDEILFQSTYLYKVRLGYRFYPDLPASFNPRTYIRYD